MLHHLHGAWAKCASAFVRLNNSCSIRVVAALRQSGSRRSSKTTPSCDDMHPFGADHWAHRCDQCRHPAAARDREVGRASIERGVTKARYCAKCSIETVACSNFREFKNLAGKANAVTGLCEGTHGSISVDDTAVRPKQCDAVGQPFNRIFKYFTAFGAGFETPCHLVRALIVRT